MKYSAEEIVCLNLQEAVIRLRHVRTAFVQRRKSKRYPRGKGQDNEHMKNMRDAKTRKALDRHLEDLGSVAESLKLCEEKIKKEIMP